MNPRHSFGKSPRNRNSTTGGGESPYNGTGHIEQLIRRSSSAALQRSSTVMRCDVPFRDRVLEQSTAAAGCPGASKIRQDALALLFGDNGDGDDDDIGVCEVEVSILCPYSRLPIRTAVRSSACTHVACADIDSWAQALEMGKAMKDPKAVCPVCGEWRRLSTLHVDRWMQHIVDNCVVGTTSVIIHQDGTVKEKDNTGPSSRKGVRVEEVDLLTQGSSQQCDSPVMVKREPHHPSFAIKNEPGREIPLPISDGDEEDEGVVCPPLRGIASPLGHVDDGVSLDIVGDVAGRFSAAPNPPQPPPQPLQYSPPSLQEETQAAQVIGALPHHDDPRENDGEALVGGFVVGEYSQQTPYMPTAPIPTTQPGEFDRGTLGPDWMPYCGACKNMCTPVVGTSDLYTCCQRTGHRLEWPLTFGVVRIGLMCTVDGFLLIVGSDADKFSARLWAAGFHRSPEREALFYGRIPPSFGRFEMDYLLALCRIASDGATSQDCYRVYPTPEVFRMEPPRFKAPGGSTWTPSSQSMSQMHQSTPMMSTPQPPPATSQQRSGGWGN